MARKPTNVTGATSDDEFDRLIAGASLPEKLVRLCLDGKLRREYEEVKARIEARAAAAKSEETNDVRLASKPAGEKRDPEQDLLDTLVERMRASSVTFVIRAMPGQEYNRLLEQHPPRKEPSTGQIDPRDYNGFNSSTFPAALVRRSIAQPTMTDERWEQLDKVLTDAQFDRLFAAAAEVNRRDEDIPF